METKKMTNQKKYNYTIINKEGEIIDDVDIENYDKLADHMLDIADKWYQGIYNGEDALQISTFDDKGDLVYSDVATFGEAEQNDDGEELDFRLPDISGLSNYGSEIGGFGEEARSSSKGFGTKDSKSRKKSRKNS